MICVFIVRREGSGRKNKVDYGSGGKITCCTHGGKDKRTKVLLMLRKVNKTGTRGIGNGGRESNVRRMIRDEWQNKAEQMDKVRNGTKAKIIKQTNSTSR